MNDEFGVRLVTDESPKKSYKPTTVDTNYVIERHVAASRQIFRSPASSPVKSPFHAHISVSL